MAWSLLLVRELIKGFHGKDIFELLVGLRHYILKVFQIGLPFHLCKLLRDGLSGSYFFRLSTNEMYKELVFLAHLIWVCACKARLWSTLSGFWLILWDLLYAHSVA